MWHPGPEQQYLGPGKLFQQVVDVYYSYTFKYDGNVLLC